MKEITTGSDFSGVGAFDYAIERVCKAKRLKHKRIYACDWDKYARITYIHNHGEPKYYPKDVYEREIPKDSLDIYMSSPPCQAFSIAGKRKGKDDERGILFFNSLEFIQVNKPRFFIFENVKGLLSDDNGLTFQEWINLLGGKSVNGLPVLFPYEDSVPYHIYWKVLNSKEHGVPQNRERVFIVGIRDDADNSFQFPKEEHLTKKLKDVLESEVDEKYFLREKAINQLLTNGTNTDHLIPGDYSNTLRCGGGASITEKHAFDMIKIVGNTNPSGNGMNGNVFDEEGISPTLSTNKGEGIKIKSETKRGYEEATENDSIWIADYRADEGLRKDGVSPCMTSSMRDSEEWNPKAGTRNPPLIGGCCIPVLTPYRLNKRQNGRRFKDDGEESFTITTQDRHGIYYGFTIRRLTPRECFRLQDFPDSLCDINELSYNINKWGIIINFNKKQVWNNAQLKDVKEKKRQRDIVLCTIKDGKNMEIQTSYSLIPTEEMKNAKLKIVLNQFMQLECATNTIIQIENTEILYTSKIKNGKLGRMMRSTAEGGEEVELLNTDILCRITLDESLKIMNTFTILTVIPIIMNYLIYTFSIVNANTINVIINYSKLQENCTTEGLLVLKTDNITSVSDSQAYKQAGKSITVRVLEKILMKLKL